MIEAMLEAGLYEEHPVADCPHVRLDDPSYDIVYHDGYCPFCHKYLCDDASF